MKDLFKFTKVFHCNMLLTLFSIREYVRLTGNYCIKYTKNDMHHFLILKSFDITTKLE